MQAPGVFRFNGITVDSAAMRVFRGPEEVPLEPKSLRLLLYLIENPGRLVSKEELLKAVWQDTFVSDNALTRIIAQIRKSLGDDAKQGRYIETVPKLGYRFIADLEAVTEPPPPAGKALAPSRWIAVGIVAILAAAITAWSLHREPDRPLSAPIPLTSYPGVEMEPSFSPDGNQVAFVWSGDKENNLDIYVKVVGAEASLRLTTDPAEDFAPEWSPDGRTIAFLRSTGADTFELILIPALGGVERRLGGFRTSYGRHRLAAAWSADSKWLIIPSGLPGVNGQALFKVSVESGESTKITDPGPKLLDSWPRISPDGKTLLFSRRVDLTEGDLYTVPVDQEANPVGAPHQIPLGGVRAVLPYWTADGRGILFRTMMNGYYRAPAAGAPIPERIPWLGRDVGVIDISRTGNRLVYSAMRGDSNIWRIALGEDGLAENSAKPEKLVASTFRDTYPQYSPDGTRLAFYSFRAGSPQLWISDAQGEDARAITFPKSGMAGTPHWSPDGKTLALDSNESGVFHVYTMSPEGGRMTPLTSGSSSNFAATWSRDGKWIYFCSNRTGRNEVWKMPSSGGVAVRVTHNGGVKALESLDSRTLFFNKDAGSGAIWRMPVGGGVETQVADSLYRFNFTVTRRGVYYMTAPQQTGTCELRFYNVATGATKTVLPIGLPEFGLDVSPDGRYLIYAQSDDAGSDLMLVENFH